MIGKLCCCCLLLFGSVCFLLCLFALYGVRMRLLLFLFDGCCVLLFGFVRSRL